MNHLIFTIFSIGTAATLWTLAFTTHEYPFWYQLAASAMVLLLLALLYRTKVGFSGRITLGKLVGGVVAAGALYGIFALGNWGLDQLTPYLPFLPDKKSSLLSVYQMGAGGLSPQLIGLLLIFPIGLAEEFFWRGFIQDYFAKRMHPWAAFLLTVGCYTAIHIPIHNPYLLVAALVCGTFWGGLYALTGSLTLVTVSHMLWDPLIFILRPLY